MRSSRFQSLTPPLRTTGLWKLKTAFSPSSQLPQSGVSVTTYPATTSSTDTTSPLSMSVCSYPFDRPGSGLSSPTGSTSDHSIFSPATTTATSCAGSPDLSTSKKLGGSLGLGGSAMGKDRGRSFGVVSTGMRLRSLLFFRGGAGKRSSVDVYLEEEQRLFGEGVDMFEPRPREDMFIGGIFEVLEGRA